MDFWEIDLQRRVRMHHCQKFRKVNSACTRKPWIEITGGRIWRRSQVDIPGGTHSIVIIITSKNQQLVTKRPSSKPYPMTNSQKPTPQNPNLSSDSKECSLPSISNFKIGPIRTSRNSTSTPKWQKPFLIRKRLSVNSKNNSWVLSRPI